MLTKRKLFCLACCNAFESFQLNRRQALWEIQTLSLQDSHWLLQNEVLQNLPKENLWERIVLDYKTQRVSLLSHPMGYFRSRLETQIVFHSKNLIEAFQNRQRSTVQVAGVVICRQMPETASGVLSVTLEDEFGFINLVVWNRVFESFREI